MQTKIVFISDRLKQFHSFIRRQNNFEYSLEIMTHVEAHRRLIYQTFYNLFIVDLDDQWLALPPWIREQSQQQYYFQFIFISDEQLNSQLEDLLDMHLLKVISFKEAINEGLQSAVAEAKQYGVEHRYNPDEPHVALDTNPNVLLGIHPSIAKINQFIDIVSKARFAPCLITGESGTGRTTSARMIHRSNNLRDDLFFIKNCEEGTTNEILGDIFGVENELEIYGPQRKGLLELYAGGTLVLKNIEKLPPEVQDKLLLFLEDRVFRPLGSDRLVDSNIRIIGITRHNLDHFVKRRKFNASLHFHLQAFEINLPSLRERSQDITLLSKYFMQFYSFQSEKNIRSISERAGQLLRNYSWPCNVEELKHVIERAVFICSGNELSENELPDYLNNKTVASSPQENLSSLSIKDLERIHIERVLNHTNGNKSRAAGILDISRTTLREKMRSYGIH